MKPLSDYEQQFDKLRDECPVCAADRIAGLTKDLLGEYQSLATREAAYEH